MGGAIERSRVPSCGGAPPGPVTARREAMPLPLLAIADIERAVMEEGVFEESPDTLLMSCLLLMFRVRCASQICACEGVVHGVAW